MDRSFAETRRLDSSAGIEMDGDNTVRSLKARRRRRQKGGHFRKLWTMLRGNQNQLPPSHPGNWPNPTIDDLKERPTRIVNINKSQEFTFCDNFIKTSKYEVWSFLPKFLAVEFHPRKKIANLYFLVISCMQVIPEITSTFGYPIVLLPLLFIVLIDMIFTILEDVSRHKADSIANSSRAVVLDADTGKWRVKQRWEVAVGDFVKVHNREEIPADLLVVGVHERYRPNCSGVCYVETKSLDGETNLKIRQVQKVLIGRVDGHEDLKSFSGRVNMEHPNKSIATFTGTLELTLLAGRGANARAGEGNILSGPYRAGGGSGPHGTAPPSLMKSTTRDVKEPITPDNLLLRGTVLRNTKWAVGLVIGTGHDTKVMMSMAKAPEKSSHLNSRINTEIKGLALMLFLFCFVGGFGSSLWQDSHNGFRSTVLLNDDNLVSDFFIQFFYYLLLLYGFVPISLYVSQNFIRFFQAWFMDQDLDMYHEPTDTPSKVRTMNLNEDLGQITHVFSDKTGTLTENVMDFRKCTVGGRSYGKGTTEIGLAALKMRGEQLSPEELQAEEKAQSLSAPHVNFYDPSLFEDLDKEFKQRERKEGELTEFMTVLALCHTVIPERQENEKEVVLSASSPDDEALVLGAKYFGFEFAERVDTSAIIHRQRMPAPLAPESEAWAEKYEVLRILGFNSVRKRMSVVVRCPRGRVRVMSKGADTTMMPLLRRDTSEELLTTTILHLEHFASEGLRTLMVGVKDMSDEEFAKWDDEYDEAINDLHEVDEQRAGRPNKIDALMTQAEEGLTLLGGTAIEDKLQLGVGETIEKLIRGGIVVWVITGDKEETAINIGVACQLLWSEDRMDRVIINTKSCPTPELVKERLQHEFERYCDDMEAGKRDKVPCKPRCLIIDGAAFSLIEDAPLTSLHGPVDGVESLRALATDSTPEPGDATNPRGSPSALSPTVRRLAKGDVRDFPVIGLTSPEQSRPSEAPGSDDLRADADLVGSPPVDVETGLRRLGGAQEGQETKNEDILDGSQKMKDMTPAMIAEITEDDALRENEGTGVERVPPSAAPAGAVGDGRRGLRRRGKGHVAFKREAAIDRGIAADEIPAKEALLRFAGVCQAVIGCRMSPDQKRQLVNLIKENQPGTRTLAIGDGANDVPMIQTAHVGVGISGQEGLQAVNASDYALAQFKFLQKLLLCHGRYNYRRMSFASSYLFYKSVSWAVPLFLYSFWNGLSGQVFYDYVASTLWAVLFTGIPVILFGIYDMDVLPKTALRYPWVYRNGVDDDFLNKTFFWGWIAQGVLESCWVTIPLMFIRTGGRVVNGATPSVWGFGQAAFQAMTIAVNMKLLFVQKRWHTVEGVVLVLSTGLMFLVCWFINASTILITLDWEFYGIQDVLFKDPNYWAVSVFGIVGVLMRDVAWKSYHRWYHPRLHHVLIEMEKGHLKDINLPVELRRHYPIQDVVQEDTSSRMVRVRSQSVQRMESHRDSRMASLGPPGSNGGTRTLGYAVSPTQANIAKWAGAFTSARGWGGSPDRRDDERPRSASARFHGVMERFNWSPTAQADPRKKGRSAGSSPVTASPLFPDTKMGGGSGAARKSLHVAGADQVKGSDRVGFAFSQDLTASEHEIEMIMTRRASSIRRAGFPPLQPASQLPTVDDPLQGEVEVLQVPKPVSIEPPLSDVSNSTDSSASSSVSSLTLTDEPQLDPRPSEVSVRREVDPSARGGGSVLHRDDAVDEERGEDSEKANSKGLLDVTGDGGAGSESQGVTGEGGVSRAAKDAEKRAAFSVGQGIMVRSAITVEASAFSSGEGEAGLARCEDRTYVLTPAETPAVAESASAAESTKSPGGLVTDRETVAECSRPAKTVSSVDDPANEGPSPALAPAPVITTAPAKPWAAWFAPFGGNGAKDTLVPNDSE